MAHLISLELHYEPLHNIVISDEDAFDLHSPDLCKYIFLTGKREQQTKMNRRWTERFNNFFLSANASVHTLLQEPLSWSFLQELFLPSTTLTIPYS